MNKSLRSVTLLVLAAAALARPAQAADSDNASLLQRIDALSARVLELEARLNHLEGRAAVPAATAGSALPAAGVGAVHTAASVPAAVAAPVSTPSPPVSMLATQAATAVPRAALPGYLSPQALLKQNWAKIVRDVRQDDVTKLLGPPSRTLVIDGRTAWYYEYPGIGVGSVFFTDDGRVSSRQQPFGWGG